MATFTMELRETIETLYGEEMDEDAYEIEWGEFEFNGVKYGKLPTLDDFGPLGLDSYPIFDEAYRPILNGLIIEEYWIREIGVETVELFVMNLRKKMNQIMPFFNQLYESTLIEYSALDSMKIQSVGSSNIAGMEQQEATTNSDSKTKSGARVVNSSFPQSPLSGNADYATSATDTNSNSEVESDVEQISESNSSTNSNSQNLVTGYQGAASDFITKFRNSFINVNTSVLSEIEDCFMGVLNNGDEYFARNNFGGF